MSSTHPTNKDAIATLARAFEAGRPVRFWLDSANEVVGIWQARNGRTVAVGRSYRRNYRVCVFSGMSPADSWERGGMIADAKTIAERRARWIAEYEAEDAREGNQ